MTKNRRNGLFLLKDFLHLERRHPSPRPLGLACKPAKSLAFNIVGSRALRRPSPQHAAAALTANVVGFCKTALIAERERQERATGRGSLLLRDKHWPWSLDPPRNNQYLPSEWLGDVTYITPPQGCLNPTNLGEPGQM